jgi:hypothetical protein
MMKWLALLAVVVLVAGCVGQSADQAGGISPTGAAITPTSSGVTVTGAPATAVVGKRFNVSWIVNSPQVADIAKTVVYYDTNSHPGTVSTGIPPSVFNYHTVTLAQKGTAPFAFTDYVSTGNSAGKIYFRVYALVGQLNYWSDEYTVTVMPRPSVDIAEVPSSVGKSSTFNVKWSVKDGYPGKVDNTRVLWGVRSGGYDKYSSEQAGATPVSFEATLTAPSTAPETLYFIVTYAVDGVQYNSTEKTVAVY